MYVAAGCPDGAVKGLSGGRRTHTAVDTAGNVPWESFEQVLPYTDLFYTISRQWIQMSTKPAPEWRTDDSGKTLQGFLPTGTRTSSSVIPHSGMNDDQVEKIAEFLHRWQQIEAELLPFHKLGNSKYRGAGGTERV